MSMHLKTEIYMYNTKPGKKAMGINKFIIIVSSTQLFQK